MHVCGAGIYGDFAWAGIDAGERVDPVFDLDREEGVPNMAQGEGWTAELGRKVAVGVITAVILVVSTAVGSSDWPGWASIGRVENLHSTLLENAIGQLWLEDYCTAERMGNHKAASAVIDDIDRIELEYSRLNGGREIPLRPCP